MSTFRSATVHNIPKITSLYDRCKVNMIAAGILQWGDWGDGYPSATFVTQSIARGEMYCLVEGDTVQAVVALNDQASAEWRDVDWTIAGEHPLIIHALAVDPDLQGRGIGHRALSAIERLARELDRDVIHLDCYPGNQGAVKLYSSNGYRSCGTVHFDSKPAGCREYLCFEKAVE
ncbi:MAG TPA: GNAT family N-acetyltransferase [Spirochaetia bacterium]|nr:GNAT family N-acetyltransferase [Spirochaetia bacterium]